MTQTESMARRPIFVAQRGLTKPIVEVMIDFQWHAGLAAIQRQKCVLSLHAAAALRGYPDVLEVSTYSESPLGRSLSAFNLQLPLHSVGLVPLESAFQASKVFQHGGPYHDLLNVSAATAKSDVRIRHSGLLIGFRLEGVDYPATPRTLFYDWLYIRALQSDPDLLARLAPYSIFSDIAFNPEKSLNCQARSCAIAALIFHQLNQPERAGSLSLFRGLYPDAMLNFE